MDKELRYRFALTRVPKIGPVHARTLVHHFGSAEAIFTASLSRLGSIEGIGEARARAIRTFRAFGEVDKELAFTRRFGIRPLFLTDAGYPQRLLQCYDPPTLLFQKGDADLNAGRMVAVIGTRHLSDYGRKMTEQLVRGLSAFGATIVSGLAIGIDAAAHRAALANGLPTIGVLAHGFSTLYPAVHTALAREMLQQNGGLLTEFESGSQPDRHHFPVRNRIVAGMCDATVVVETGIRGGSMITAELANGYHKDVFAFPGRAGDPGSAGCNHLIRTNRAILLTEARQLAECLGWDPPGTPAPNPQKALFTEYSEAEMIILRMLQQQEPLHIDELNNKSGLSSSATAAAILQLELQHAVQVLPGRRYRLA